MLLRPHAVASVARVSLVAVLTASLFGASNASAGDVHDLAAPSDPARLAAPQQESGIIVWTALMAPESLGVVIPVRADQGPTARSVDPPQGLTLPRSVVTPSQRSSRALVPLYLSYAVLQGLDAHSTLLAVSRGGQEGNSIMAPMVNHPAAMVAFKAGSTAVLILAANRLSKRNRTAAFALMIAGNIAYAAIVARNYQIANSLQR